MPATTFQSIGHIVTGAKPGEPRRSTGVWEWPNARRVSGNQRRRLIATCHRLEDDHASTTPALRITATTTKLLKGLLWHFLNSNNGRCFPGHQLIAKRLKMPIATVRRHLKRLEAHGLITWLHRLKRVRAGQRLARGRIAEQNRVHRTSNTYAFTHQPKFSNDQNDRVSLPTSVASLPCEPQKAPIQRDLDLQARIDRWKTLFDARAGPR